MSRNTICLTILTVAAMLALASCGSDKGLPAGGGGGGARTYIGASSCIRCHTEVGAHWKDTGHGHALATLERIGMDKPSCLPCHVLAYNKPGGFISKTETPTLGDVQCENCHGPGSAHAASPSAANIVAAPGPEVCGTCHTDAHHPTYDEWRSSSHAKSLEDSPRDKCMVCHSQEGFFYQLQEPITPPAPAARVVEAKTNIECATCHDPHMDTGHAAQLRLDTKQLCETCHRLSSASVNDDVAITSQPRHGASLVFEGQGAKTPNGNVGGAAMVGPNSAHTTAAAEGCATCHVFKVDKPSPNTDDPNVTGHTFEPNLMACTQAGCHKPTAPARAAITDGADPKAARLVKYANGKVDAAIAACKPYVTTGDAKYIDRNTLTGKDLNDYDVALWDYRLIVNNDPSRGVHNLDYATATLDTALRTFQRLAP